MRMRCGLFLGTWMLAAGCGGASGTHATTVETDDGTSTITLVNASSAAVYHLFFSQVDSASWGEDMLGGDVLLPTEHASVLAPCDVWDIRIVDEDGSDCVLESVAICAEDGGLILEDGDLAVCEAFGS